MLSYIVSSNELDQVGRSNSVHSSDVNTPIYVELMWFGAWRGGVSLRDTVLIVKEHCVAKRRAIVLFSIDALGWSGLSVSVLYHSLP